MTIDDPAHATDEAATFLQEALAGLRERPRRLPSKYFYDARGSELFEQICDLPEYYPTRTELGLMGAHGAEMAEAIGPGALIIEYGSGAGLKTRRLLESLEAPAGYIPVEISDAALEASVVDLTARFPELVVRPMCADYTRPFALPSIEGATRRVVYYPGSTIGNFAPEAARDFLALMAEQIGPEGGVLIGVDLRKDPAILHDAYNDSAGITAQFNLNVARRLRDELGADIDLGALRHYAPYDPAEGRIEMHLVNLRRQTFALGEDQITLEAGETILTEYSYKYTVDGFTQLAARAGLAVEQTWVDDGELFSVHCLRPS